MKTLSREILLPLAFIGGVTAVTIAHDNIPQVKDEGNFRIEATCYPGKNLEANKQPNRWVKTIINRQTGFSASIVYEGSPKRSYPLTYSANWRLITVGLYGVEGGWYRHDETYFDPDTNLRRGKPEMTTEARFFCPTHIVKDLVYTFTFQSWPPVSLDLEK